MRKAQIIGVLFITVLLFLGACAPKPTPTPTPALAPTLAPAPAPTTSSEAENDSMEGELMKSIEELCKEFYDSQIFHAVIAGTDVWSSYLDSAYKSVVDADPSFSAVDLNLFQQEMTALHMEIFALAFSQKFKRQEFAISQSLFTRRYLEERGRLDTWNIMGEYNQAIAESAHLTEHGEPIDERSWVHINKLRTDMFVKWAEANIGDPDSMTKEDEENANCVARVGNRIGADMRQADCIGVKVLAARLADRLGCSKALKTEALFWLETVIFGFYMGAEEYLKSVDIRA